MAWGTQRLCWGSPSGRKPGEASRIWEGGFQTQGWPLGQHGVLRWTARSWGPGSHHCKDTNAATDLDKAVRPQLSLQPADPLAVGFWRPSHAVLCLLMHRNCECTGLSQQACGNLVHGNRKRASLFIPESESCTQQRHWEELRKHGRDTCIYQVSLQQNVVRGTSSEWFHEFSRIVMFYK